MRYTTTRLLALACALLAALALAACGDDDAGIEESASSGADAPDVEFESPESKLPNGYPRPEPEQLRIGLSVPIAASEPIQILIQSMEAAVEELGGELVTLDANLDPDRQVSNVEQLVAQEVDGIVVFPLDPGAVTPAVRSAGNAGIPTLAVEYNNEQPEETGPFDTQILQGTDLLAYLEVKEMAELLGEGGKVVQLGLNVPAPTIVAITNRTKKWASEFGLDYLGRVDNPSDDIAGGESAMSGALTRYPDVEGVLAYNDASAIGASAAARSAGKQELVLFGNYGGATDGLSAIEQGRISGTVVFDQPGVGRFAAWGIYDLAQGVEVPKAVLPGEPQVVTVDNVEGFLQG